MEGRSFYSNVSAASEVLRRIPSQLALYTAHIGMRLAFGSAMKPGGTTGVRLAFGSARKAYRVL